MNVIGGPELIEDPRYKEPDSRFMHALEINGVVGEWVAQHTRGEVVDILESKGIPVAPVLECWEAIQDPQVKHNEMIVEFPYTGLRNIPMPGFPVKMSETKGAVYRGAPRVGEHTDEVLREYGYSTPTWSLYARKARSAECNQFAHVCNGMPFAHFLYANGIFRIFRSLFGRLRRYLQVDLLVKM